MMEHIGYFFRKLGKEKEFYSMLKNKAKHPSEIRRYVINTRKRPLNLQSLKVFI